MANSIYRGIAFPFRADTTGFPGSAEDDELIRMSVIQCILTAKGERVMRPDFGSGAFAYVFENNDDLLAEVIRLDVKNTISKYEPRALVQDVVVARTEDAAGNHVVITVSFVVAATKRQHSVQAQIQVP